MRRYKRNPDTGDLLFYGGIVIAAYFAWQWISGKLAAVPAAAKAAYNTAVNTASTALDVLGNQNNIATAALGPMTYHTVAMPDGSNASIPSTSVDANGNFIYQGASYNLTQNAAGYYLASANNAATAAYSVNIPSGTVQVPASGVNGGEFIYQGASYLLVTMPDGSMAGVFPSSLDTSNAFIYWLDGVSYIITSSGGMNTASVNFS